MNSNYELPNFYSKKDNSFTKKINILCKNEINCFKIRTNITSQLLKTNPPRFLFTMLIIRN